MTISKSLQQKLDKYVPKREQNAFVELAITKELHKLEAMNAEMVELFVDGGSRGNPGPAGGGFVVFKGVEKVLEGSEFYGEKTNNQSEYLALRTALRETFNRFPDFGIQCFMDSQLVVEQMKGNYKVKNVHLKQLFTEVSRISTQFKSFTIEHIRREQNELADALANKAMDRKH